MAFVWCLIVMSLISLLALFVLFFKKNINKKIGKLKQKTLFSKVCLQCYKSCQTSKCFFCGINKNNVVNKFTNNFLTSTNFLVQVNRKVVKLNNNKCSTTHVGKMLVHCKQYNKNNGCYLFNVKVNNLSNEPKKITIWLKNNFLVNTPNLITKKNNGIIFHSHEQNSLAVVCYNHKKQHQNVKVSKGMNEAIHKVTLLVKGYGCETLKWLLTYKQGTMQSVKSTEYPVLLQTGKNETFNWKISVLTKNEELNNLINNFLPNIIEKHCTKNKLNMYNYVFTTNVSNLQSYSYNKVIKWLLARREFARCYHYLLVCVLGVQPMGGLMRFFKQHQMLGNFTIQYQNYSINKYNFANYFYFLFNQIIYKNVFVLHLNKPKLDVQKKFLS